MATEVNAKVMAVVVLGIVSVSHWKKNNERDAFLFDQKKKKIFRSRGI